jgi:hypothetical protein
MSDDTTDDVLTDDAIEAAFVKRFSGEESNDPPEAPKEVTETPDEDTEGTTSTETEEAPKEAPEAPSEKLADDDHLVVIGDRKVAVKDLRDLAAREDAIKARDTESTTQAQVVRQQAEANVQIIGKAIETAQKELEPFLKIDWVDARVKLPIEAYEQLKADYQVAATRVNFLKQEGNTYVQGLQQARQGEHAKAIATRDKALSESKDFGEGGWEKARGEVEAYAAKAGLGDLLKSVTSPLPVMMVHKAMLFDRGVAAVEKAKPAATSAPKKVLTPGSNDSSAALTKLDAARQRYKKSMTDEDGEAIFAARFG